MTALLSCVLALSFAVLALSFDARAAPYSAETAVSGTIEDMWLDGGVCYFRILVLWSESSSLDGETVDAMAMFLNESDGTYDPVPSSRGWMVGDTVNAILAFFGDEYQSLYTVYLESKSEENFAEPLGLFDRYPLLPYWALVFAAMVASVVIPRLVFGARYSARSDQVKRDYFRFLRRI